ncbi:MAG: hypothetical protein ACOH1V_02440 [Stenotrophomonas sp.]
MNKSVIVYGPKGSGKTAHAEDLRQHFALDRIVDDWNGSDPYPRHGALVLTSNASARVAAHSNAMHIGGALRQLCGKVPV